MKKAVLLNSSPHRDGFTQKLIDIFFEDFTGEVHTYNMYYENFAPCIGCGKCEKLKHCFMHDMNNILSDIFSSDYIIFASPVYNYSFPSPMKAFLDRLQPYYSDEKEPPVRKGFLLVSCGKSGKFSIDVMEKQSKIAFSELSADYCGCCYLPNTDKETTLQHNFIRKAKKLAAEFFG